MAQQGRPRRIGVRDVAVALVVAAAVGLILAVLSGQSASDAGPFTRPMIEPLPAAPTGASIPTSTPARAVPETTGPAAVLP